MSDVNLHSNVQLRKHLSVAVTITSYDGKTALKPASQKLSHGEEDHIFTGGKKNEPLKATIEVTGGKTKKLVKLNCDSEATNGKDANLSIYFDPSRGPNGQILCDFKSK